MKTLLIAVLLALGAAAPAFAQTTYADYGDPTAGEQQILEIINRARDNPFAEGTRLGIDIREGLTPAQQALVNRRPPLAMNAKLLDSARLHSQDMWTRDYFEHNAPPPTASDPGSRMTASGYVFSGSWRWGENIAAGTGFTQPQLQDFLMIDSTEPDRGHRLNLLDIYNAAPFREVGIGFYHGASSKPNALTDQQTQDFARTGGGGPFIVGVVYNDSTPNNFYDPGEGISGVTITPSSGAFKGVTATAGGYAFPTATSGTITLTPSGGVPWKAGIVKKVILHGENVKVDFKQSDGVDTDSDGMPDAWETANGFNPNGTPGDLTEANGDADGDLFSNVEEFRYGSDPHNAASTPNDPRPLGPPGPVPPASTPKKKSGGGGGGCGLTGLEAAALLGLAAAFRRRGRA